jgi:hypothetical protein
MGELHALRAEVAKLEKLKAPPKQEPVSIFTGRHKRGKTEVIGLHAPR